MNQLLKYFLLTVLFFSVPVILQLLISTGIQNNYINIDGVQIAFFLWLYIFISYIKNLDKKTKVNKFLDNLVQMEGDELVNLLNQSRVCCPEAWSEKDKQETKRNYLFTSVLGTSPFYKRNNN